MNELIHPNMMYLLDFIEAPVVSDTLSSIADLYNCSLDDVWWRLFDQVETPRTGFVLGIGAEAHEAAKLYAKLTGRVASLVDKCPSEVELRASSVVVILASDLSSALLNGIYRPDGSDSVPGIIFARGSRDLSAIALKFAGSLACSKFSTLDRGAFLYPNEDFALSVHKKYVFHGGNSQTSDVIGSVSHGFSVLSVITHANDFDLPLTAALHLCPYKSPDTERPLFLPACINIGKCTQMAGMPSLNSERYLQNSIGPRSIKARALIVLTCAFIRTDSRARFANDLKMPSQLLVQASIGVCITTWRDSVYVAGGAQINEIVNDLEKGERVGAVLAKYNGREALKKKGNCLCLIGDPDYEMLRSTELSYLPTSEGVEEGDRKLRPIKNDWTTEIARRRALLVCRGDTKTFASHDYAVSNLSDEQLREPASWLDDRESTRSNRLELNKISARAMIDHLSFIDAVSSGLTLSSLKHEVVCDLCAAPSATETLFQSMKSEECDVVRQHCTLCGIFRVGPIGCPDVLVEKASFKYRIRLSHYPVEVRAVIAIKSAGYSLSNLRVGSGKYVIDWPVSSSGDLEEEFILPDHLIPAPFRCEVAVAWTSGHSICHASVC